MANTLTKTLISSTPNKVLLYVTLLSDGTEETASIIYDSSVQVALITDPPYTGAVLPDPLTSTIMLVDAQFSTVTGTAQLLYDATTDVLAVAIPPSNHSVMDFRYAGGLKNYAGSGKTGDILLTTSTLAAGDSLSFILNVRPA